MPFDESSAVLDEAPQFDAASAKPEFDEASAVEDSLGATAASAGSSPGVGSIPPAKTPTLGEVLSAQGDTIVESARRVGSGIAEAATTAAAGLSRISEVTPPTMLGRVIAKQLTGEDPLQKGREFLGEVQRAARPSFGVDPTKDKELVSKVIAGATSLVPIIASGPAAPLTAAGLMGESARQDAEARGATEGQKAAAFAGGATIGVISEGLLGIPALLRSAMAAGATDAVLKSITRQAVEQGLKNTVRESSQEAIEQVSQNLLANTVVGYDPTRETSSGVLEAAGLGAAIGGPVGALVQTAVTLDARTDASFEQLKQEAESVAAPEAPQTAVPETPVETTAAPEASILRKVVTGEPVTLFHGSKKAGLTTTHPNSSFTLSRELAQKFAGPEGVVYEGMAPVPETNPARWSAEELLADVEAGKITEADAERAFLQRISEIRPEQEVSVRATQEIAVEKGAPAETPAPPPLSEGPHKADNELRRAHKIAQGFIWNGGDWVHPDYPGRSVYSDEVPPPRAERVREELAKIRGESGVDVSGIPQRAERRDAGVSNQVGDYVEFREGVVAYRKGQPISATKKVRGKITSIKPDGSLEIRRVEGGYSTKRPEELSSSPSKTPAPPVGQSNLTAAVEKNIADARMMAPDDPAGFLRKMADSSRKQGKEEAAANFEAAEAELKSEGPGAAAATEFQPQQTTGLKRAVVDTERLARGAEEIPTVERQREEAVVRAAEDAVDADPTVAPALIERINSGTQGRAITEQEAAMLLVERQRLHNEKRQAEETAADAEIPEEQRATARAQWQEAEARLNELDHAQRTAGSTWGRLGHMYQRLIQEDFTLSAMERRTRAAKGGEPLTETESTKIKEQAAEIARLEKLVEEAQKTEGGKQEAEATASTFGSLERDVRKGGKKKDKSVSDLSARAKADSAAGDPLDHSLVYEIARAHVRAGVRGENAVMKATHGTLAPFFEGLTERDIRRAFSEYGKVKFPSKEEVATHLRELRTLVRLQESIDRETAGLSALHSGMQRDKATQAIREKQKRLNELLKKRQGPPSPEQLASRDEARKTALRNQIEDIDKQLRTGDKTAKGEPSPPSAEAEQLMAERDAMRGKLREIQAAENPPKSEAEKQIEQLTKQREKLDKVFSGEEAPKTAKEWQALSNVAADIKAEIQAMQELAAQMRRDAKPKTDPEYAKEQTRIKALEAAINRYSEKTAASDFGATPKTEGPDTARVAALKEIRDSRRVAYEAARKASKPVRTPEEIYNETRMKTVRRQLAEAEKRISEGDFEKRTKKPMPAKDTKLIALEAALEKEKNIIRREEHKLWESRLPKLTKLRRGTRAAFDASKNLVTAYDFSAPRQGLIAMLTHPVAGARAFGRMFRGAFSESQARQMEQARQHRANAKDGTYKQAGLEFTALDETTFTLKEENLRSVLDDWAQQPFRTGSTAKTIATAAPRVIAKGVRISNRAFITFLNELRADVMDSLIDANFRGRAKPTPNELSVLGNLVNVTTGRGRINPKLASSLAIPLWSPRLLASRFQYVLGQPLWHGLAHGKVEGSGRARLIVAKEYAKFMVGAYALYNAAKLFGDVEDDPRSSDFGKIRLGEDGRTRLDPWGGLQQVSVLLTRETTGETKTLKKGEVKAIRFPEGTKKPFKAQDVFEMEADFLRTKFSPWLGTFTDWRVGENVVGEKVTLGSMAQNMVVPLSYRDVFEVLRNNGVPKGIALQMLSQFGAGLSVYEEQSKERPR